MKWAAWSILALVVCFGALWRLDLVNQTPIQAVENAYLDDAFFYVLVAENIAGGNGSTLDGINETNGYHPLWMGLLVLLHSITDSEDFFSAHLALSALFSIGSFFFVWKFVSLFSQNLWVRVSTFSLYALNPRVVYLTMNGMETSLMMFLLSAFLYMFFLWWQNRNRSVQFFALFGILSALLFLTRTDSLVILGVVFLAMLYLDRTLWWKKFVILALPTALTFLAYVLYNYVYFGSPMPTNALATYVEWHYIYGVGMYPGSLVELFWFLKHGAFSVVNDIMDRADALSMVPTILIALGVAVALYFAPDEDRKIKSDFEALSIVSLGFALLFFANSFIRYFNVDYYIVPWNLLTVALASLVFGALTEKKYRYNVLIILLLVGIAYTSFFITYRRTYALDVSSATKVNEAVEVARWTNNNLPYGTRIGSMRRAGVSAYFSEHVVINLDGKINNGVLQYKIDKQLYDYLKENNIGYVIEQDGKLQEVYPVFASASSAGATFEPVYLPQSGGVGIFKITFTSND